MNTADPKIIEQFKNLPQKLKDALFSEETTDAIFAIGKENNLTVYQMGELADETGLIILGLTRPEEYAKNVAQKIGTDAPTTNKIIQAINQKIFDPIREELKTLHRVEAAPSTPRTGAETAPSMKKEEMVAKSPILIPVRPTVESIKPVPAVPVKESTPPANLPTVMKAPEIVATPMVKPPEPMPQTPSTPKITMPSVPNYKGSDPYREALDEEVKSPFAKTPVPIVAPSPDAPIKNIIKEVGTPASGQGPERRSAPPPLIATPPPKPITWEDIAAHPETRTTPTGSGEDAKIALEKILNPSQTVTPVPPTPKSYVIPSPAEKSTSDPYREPIE